MHHQSDSHSPDSRKREMLVGDGEREIFLSSFFFSVSSSAALTGDFEKKKAGKLHGKTRPPYFLTP